MKIAVAALGLALSFAPAVVGAPGNSVSGKFSVKGKEIPLAHVAAFRDKTNIVVVLSDKQVPSSTWKSSDDMSDWRRDNPFLGVAIWIDAANAIDRGEIYDGREYPTSVSGVFELKFERAADAVSGSLKSTAGAAKMSNAIVLEATFKAALK